MPVDYSALLARLRERADDHFGIDARALASFRILLGSILLLDLLLRARNLGTLYTDDGLYPVAVLTEQYPLAARFSVHALSGALWSQVVLFTLAGGCALLLVVGYRTRLATVACFYLLVSLHIRNLYVLSAGDTLLQHVLFWALFLPLGERWSVDARRATDARRRVVSVATVAILVQILLIYGVNAVLKVDSDIWLSGSAVETIFRVNRYTEWLGPVLAEFPLVLQAANWAWVALLVLSPLLVVTTRRLRALLVAAFAAVHFGMFLTMQLGIFPLASMTALVVFVPSLCWDALDDLSADWSLRAVAGQILTTVDARAPTLSRPVSPPMLSQLTTWSARTLVVVVLIGIVSVNAIAVGLLPVPPQADEKLSGDYSDSRWTLFAPNPPQNELWVTASGRLETGESVDVLADSPLHWRDPDAGRAAYSTARMRKYASRLGEEKSSRAALAGYLCAWWDRSHDSSLTAVTIALVSRPPDDDGTQETRRVLSTHSCVQADAVRGQSP